MGTPGPFELIIILFVLLIPAILVWRICSKTGFPGALGLLMLVPVANFILLCVLAFAEWTIEQELREARQGRHD